MKSKTPKIIAIVFSVFFVVSAVLFYDMFRWWHETFDKLIIYGIMLAVATGGMGAVAMFEVSKKLKIVPRILLAVLAFAIGGGLSFGCAAFLDNVVFHYTAYQRVSMIAISLSVLYFATMLLIYSKKTIFAKAKLPKIVYSVIAVCSVVVLVLGIFGSTIATPLIQRLVPGNTGSMGGYATSNDGIKYAFAATEARYTIFDKLEGEADVSLQMKAGQEKNFQILVGAENKSQNITLTVTDFTNANGDKLTTTILQPQYANTHKLASMFDYTSMIPDNIKVVDKAAATVYQGKQQAFYVLAESKLDTPEGEYTATLRLSDESGTVVLEKNITATVAGSAMLKYDENGEFKIVQLTDLHSQMLSDFEMKLIEDSIAMNQPDLVVLSGDIIQPVLTTWTEAPAQIDQLMKVFEKYGVAVAFCYGNHDSEIWGQTGAKIQHWGAYSKYDCFVGSFNMIENRAGNYNLPIYSSDGSKIVSNVYVFDSGMYNYENLKGGYAAVKKSQIDWYVALSNELKAANGGQSVPSLSFQHIVVPEIFDALNRDGSGWKLPEGGKGSVEETPCPPNFNNGQFAAFVQQGDVLATMSGHEHPNTFEVEYQGIDIINTQGGTFSSYGSDNRGYRVFTLNEDNPWEYETQIVTYLEVYADNEEMLEQLRSRLG